MLKAPPRFGVGRELQDRCGESNQALTDWIDSIETPKECSNAAFTNPRGLQRSAKFQCGAWYVSSLFPFCPPELVLTLSFPTVGVSLI